MIVLMSRESPPARVRRAYAETSSVRDMSRPLPAPLSWLTLSVFVTSFAAAIIGLNLSLWLPAWYGTVSALTFAAYGLDKSAARHDSRRISESTLLTLGFLGGWPGGLVAQQLFRHKTRKRSFRRAFWTRVVANVLLLAVVVYLMLHPEPVAVKPQGVV